MSPGASGIFKSLQLKEQAMSVSGINNNYLLTRNIFPRSTSQVMVVRVRAARSRAVNQIQEGVIR